MPQPGVGWSCFVFLAPKGFRHFLLKHTGYTRQTVSDTQQAVSHLVSASKERGNMRSSAPNEEVSGHEPEFPVQDQNRSP